MAEGTPTGAAGNTFLIQEGDKAYVRVDVIEVHSNEACVRIEIAMKGYRQKFWVARDAIVGVQRRSGQIVTGRGDIMA